jgi:hypothetical protein
MKKTILFILGGILLAGTGILSTGFYYPDGAPAGMTGSPGDGNNCTSCHGGTPSNVQGWITSNIPASGYVPGQSYQITATNGITTGSGKYGFEVSPQSASGALLGTLTAGTANKLIGNGKYVTHSNASSNTVWNFTWTAPVAGTGTVTFYGAFVHGKPGPVALTNLAVTENSTGLTENLDEAIISLFPNPCKDQFQIVTPASANDQQVVVYDIEGKEVYRNVLPANQTRLSVDLKNASKGFASVVISGNGKQTIKKLLVD